MRKTEEYIREGNFQIKGGKRKKEKKGKKEIDIRTRGLREEHEQLASSGEFVISHLYTQSVILSFFSLFLSLG